MKRRNDAETWWQTAEREAINDSRARNVFCGAAALVPSAYVAYTFDFLHDRTAPLMVGAYGATVLLFSIMQSVIPPESGITEGVEFLDTARDAVPAEQADWTDWEELSA